MKGRAAFIGALLLLGAECAAQLATAKRNFGRCIRLIKPTPPCRREDCTLAANAAAPQRGRLAIQVQVFRTGSSKEGGLLASYAGVIPKLKAILLLAHIDVVEAKREDWTRDPFQLIEENGNFYARGSIDDKAEAAIWVDTLIRYRTEKYRPLRTIKLALTCGEETAGAFNGAQWLTQNRLDFLDAAFAINEGAWGELDAAGNRVVLQVQDGEKFHRLSSRGNQPRRTPRPVKVVRSISSPPDAHRRVRVPGAVHRRQPRVLQRHGENPAGQGRPRGGARHERIPQRSQRCAGHCAGFGQGSELECHAAHDLRRHDARGGTRDQCPATACAPTSIAGYSPESQWRTCARSSRK
jgi:hypothetical protein